MMNFPYTFRRDGSVSLRAQLFIWVWSEKLFLSIPKSKTEKNDLMPFIYYASVNPYFLIVPKIEMQ